MVSIEINFQCVLGEDLDENLHEGFGVYPSNLPEMHSLYHLAVDVQAVVDGQPLDALVLTSIYSRVPLPDAMETKDDTHYDKMCKPKLIEKSTKGYEIKRRCGLPCDCSIWGPTHKPKKTVQAGESNQSNDSDETMIDQTEDSSQTEQNSPEESALLEERSEDTESLGKSIASRPSWQDHEMEQTSGSRSQRQSMHEELNTMLLTYKYVSKTNY